MDPFQQMSGGPGPGQMMAQQQQQRPSQGPQASSQIQAIIYSNLQQQTGTLTGWRTQIMPNERMGLIFNIIGNLRLASQSQSNSPSLQRMIEIGMRFEKDIFDKSQNKEIYKQEVQMKLEQLLERRAQNQAGMQQQIHQQAQQQAQQAQAQQQMMMNQNNMPGQAPRGMPPQPPQQGYQHLQRQMQASPLPGQQPPQAPMGLQNQGLPQNMAQNQQQFVPMPQQQNMGGRPGNGQQPMTQQDNAVVNELTNRLMSQASEEEKNALRTSLQQRMDPAQFNKYQTQGVDPIFMYFRNQAMNRLRQERSQRMQQQAQAQQQQLALSQQQSQNGPVAPPMQPQRSMNPSPMNGQTQPPASVGGNSDFGSFMGNMENLAAQQQQQGVLAQEAGQMVVPASVPPRNGTPQPGMAGQNIDMVPNPNPRAQQQQHMFNAQQIQQQRMQHAQQQQQQSQARLNAQQKAQAIGLRGQPGGMGPGPNPPQQSPAMATLNAPLRTPSQPIAHAEPPQVNPNAQFGQPIDPRFMQGNRPGPANGMTFAALNPAMLQNMTPEAQQRLATLPPDKLNDVVKQWHESQNRQMNAANMGRSQMSMQGPGQVRPGQQMPPGSFNPQSGGNQFMMGNPGQRPSQQMAANMNPQQHMILQQQMASIRQQSQIQQRGAPVAAQMDQRTVQQMDNVEIPQIFQNHVNMPQGSPPEIKKWGQLKQWIAQNPNLAGTNSLDAVKSLQRLHYTQAVRSRQSNPVVGMQPGAQATPGGPPNAPPAMVAPVAPMIPVNGMNMPGLGQIRQPTPQEIHTMRTHPSGKLAQASDDQIRAMFMRNQASQLQQQAQAQAQAQGQGQMTLQQQQQRQQMMALQVSRMQQANGQAPPHMAGKPIPNPMGQAQPKPGQAPKQPQTGPNSGALSHPEPATGLPNASNNRPNARPQPNARNTAQASSPAQAPKNLKRASSDDVIEVPNPNIQQSRPSPQPAQDSSQQPRQHPTPQQLAAMDPETRKRYEHAMRAAQSSNQAPKMSAEHTRLAILSKEEQAKVPHTLPDIPMDEETRKKTAAALLSVLQGMINVSKALPRWFQVDHDEAQARRFFQARFRFGKQFRSDFLSQPNATLKDTFSINVAEIENTRSMLGAIVKVLSERYPNMKKPDGSAKSQQGPASQGEAQQSHPAQPPTPLNAANLHQQQQQLNKLHQRNNSRSSNTPAAPTSSQPPFAFGATSPHGTPAYASKNPLKQEDLHIPARKKQKQNSTPVPGQGTPGSSSSPQVSKAVSPDMKRHQSDAKQRSKPSLCCSEPECDRHNVGFDSTEALKAHTQEEHIRPLENPLKYVQENLATTLGLDSQGQSKKPATSLGLESGPAATKMTATGSRQGQTPTIKGENTPSGATPMNRQVSMNRQGSTTGGKANLTPKSVPSKDVPGKTQPGQKDANKQKETQVETVAPNPWANATIDPHDLYQSFQPFETGAGGAISDMNVYRSITPNDTPESSKDGLSEPNSDISDGVGLDISLDIFDDMWMPFGPGDTDGLFDMSGFNVNGEEDLPMFDADPPAINYKSWDDMVDTSAFDKPFSFDTAMYSMTAE